MDKLRALLVTARGIDTVELDNTDTDSHVRDMLRLIGCRMFDGAGYPDARHAAWVDDEGLLTAQTGTLVLSCAWHRDQLFGNLLVTGFDFETGETTSATMAAEELAGMVKGYVMLPDPEDGAG